MRATTSLLVVLLVAVACGGGTPAKPAPSASPAGPVEGTSLAAWQACGSDVVPPRSVLALPALPVHVDVAKTNGAVSQAEGDKWARAFLREGQIEDWAGATGREQVFKSGCLGSLKAYQILFAGEVATIEKARAAGGHIDPGPAATVIALHVVPAPMQAQTFVASLTGETPTYAIVVNEEGPLASYVVDAQGRRIEKLGETAAGVTFALAVFGQFQDNQIGPIWYQVAGGNCQSAWMGGTCNESP